MSIGEKLATAMIACVLLVGIQPVSGQTVDKSEFREKAKEGLKKSCIANQINSKENERLSSDVILRYCDCIARRGIEVLTVQEFAEAGREGRPGREMQMKLSALSKACASCMVGPPCKDE